MMRERLEQISSSQTHTTQARHTMSVATSTTNATTTNTIATVKELSAKQVVRFYNADLRRQVKAAKAASKATLKANLAQMERNFFTSVTVGVTTNAELVDAVAMAKVEAKVSLKKELADIELRLNEEMKQELAKKIHTWEETIVGS